MPVRPVDFQVMLPKTQELSKIHNDEQHKSQVLHQQQVASVRHKADENLRQVHSKDNTQHAYIAHEQDRNQGNKKENKKKKPVCNKKNSSNSEDNESTIDIKL